MKRQGKRFIYGIAYPRNFANEYTVFRIAPEYRTQWDAFVESASNDPNSDAHRITRKEAYSRGKWNIVDFADYVEGALL